MTGRPAPDDVPREVGPLPPGPRLRPARGSAQPLPPAGTEQHAGSHAPITIEPHVLGSASGPDLRGAPASVPRGAPRETWSGEMRIVSFITLPSTVERVLLHLDLPHRPPPGVPPLGALPRPNSTSISLRPSTSRIPSPSRSTSSTSRRRSQNPRPTLFFRPRRAFGFPVPKFDCAVANSRVRGSWASAQAAAMAAIPSSPDGTTSSPAAQDLRQRNIVSV